MGRAGRAGDALDRVDKHDITASLAQMECKSGRGSNCTPPPPPPLAFHLRVDCCDPVDADAAAAAAANEFIDVILLQYYPGEGEFGFTGYLSL